MALRTVEACYYSGIMAESMPGPVRDALKLYLDEENRRSLRLLVGKCAQHGITASLPTLKRWSARYHWQQLVVEHDQAVAEQSMARTIDSQALAMQAHFKLIDTAKRRHDCLLDPSNPMLRPAQRRRATRVTVSDYVRLLKMEDELYKRLERFETIGSAEPEKPTNSYTPQELEAMMRALAEVRHGLPPMRRDRVVQKNQQPHTHKSCTS